ncbi:MAG TPA: chaperone modulator CbpM [Ramlibacter sp.]|nr:chaperone modulator CbpM [Ramlibacter sp.]
MRPQTHDWHWLDASETIGAADLSRACGVSTGDLDELVEYGALTPLAKATDERIFSAACVGTLRTAFKLRQDYDLDIFTVALLLEYLTRIEALERELRTLHAQLPAHVVVHREGPPPWREPHAKSGG